MDDPAEILDFGRATGNPNAKYLVRPTDPEQASAYDKVLNMGKTAAEAWLTSKDVAIRQRVDNMDSEIAAIQGIDQQRADALRGVQRDMTLSLLNRDVYFQNELPELMPRGWGRVTDEAGLRKANLSPEMLVNSEQGYFGALYKNENTGTYVYANRGTDERIDWVHNFLQSVGAPSKQYQQAIDIARRIARSDIADQVTFTGHSLGGGLASAQSIVTGLPGVTFNAAGLNRATVAPYGVNLSRSDSLVKAYYVKGELLSTMQDSGATAAAAATAILGAPVAGAGAYAALSKLPQAAGTRIALNAVTNPVLESGMLMPGQSYAPLSPATSLDLHGMTNVLNGMFQRYVNVTQPIWRH